MRIYAKCNLSLNVVGRRRDGYHELDMVVCSVSLFDEIELAERGDGAVLCEMGGVPQTSNAALSAALRYRRAAEEEGLRLPGWTVRIRKGIPFRAGLGGSSADAAGVLRLLGERYPGPDIRRLAPELGSDTAYMLEGGFARMRGRGERVDPFCCPHRLYFLFLADEAGVSTGEAFARADGAGGARTSDNARLIRCLEAGDLTGAAEEMRNGLFDAAAALNPAVRADADALRELGALCVNMTGSGSGVYALFVAEKEAEEALAKLPQEYRRRCRVLSTV